MLPDEPSPEPRCLEHHAVAQIETVIDRGLEAIEVGNRFLQPTKCLAHSGVDLLKTLDVRVGGRNLSCRLVFGAQFVEQRGSVGHRSLACRACQLLKRQWRRILSAEVDNRLNRKQTALPGREGSTSCLVEER